jgi:hypothetical protein
MLWGGLLDLPHPFQNGQCSLQRQHHGLAHPLRHKEKGLAVPTGLGAPVDRIMCSMARPDAPGLRASPGTWTRAYRPP